MTTGHINGAISGSTVVEAYRLDRYDNSKGATSVSRGNVVEAYRLDRYDNSLATGGIAQYITL